MGVEKVVKVYNSIKQYRYFIVPERAVYLIEYTTQDQPVRVRLDRGDRLQLDYISTIKQLKRVKNASPQEKEKA